MKLIPVGVSEAFPYLGAGIAWRTGNIVDIEPNTSICAPGLVHPGLLGAQQVGTSHELKH